MRTANVTQAARALLCCSMMAAIQPTRANQSAPAQQNGPEVIVIGCLVRLDDSNWRPGTTASAGGRSSPPSSGFALKDAAVVPQPTAVTGMVATKSEREFRLPKTDVALEKFEGRQVELKGRLIGGDSQDAGEASMKTGRGAATPSADAHPAADSRASNQTGNTLQVTAARALSQTCPAQGGR
jgi:hypothetical protein